MIALVQRVREASVTVDNTTIGAIDRGLLVFLGIHSNDTTAEADWLARKCARLRIFADDAGQMNLSARDVNGEVLLISQFTLYGNTKKGHRPSFVEAARPEIAEPLYEYFKDRLSDELGYPVACGSFGAFMQVSLVNDGPVTIAIEREPKTQKIA
ncbi:MAG: D-tyrosyl-tRNA(Tyr) deacylase [Rhodothermaceae bacterium]|nr:D-tyrosyl-tRNA(Tyr) deacylase [Rhodothermaceae bacterium]